MCVCEIQLEDLPCTRRWILRKKSVHLTVAPCPGGTVWPATRVPAWCCTPRAPSPTAGQAAGQRPSEPASFPNTQPSAAPWSVRFVCPTVRTLCAVCSSLIKTLFCPAGEKYHPWPSAPRQSQWMQQSDGLHALPQPAHVPVALRPLWHHWFLYRSHHLQHCGGFLPQPAQTEGKTIQSNLQVNKLLSFDLVRYAAR